MSLILQHYFLWHTTPLLSTLGRKFWKFRAASSYHQLLSQLCILHGFFLWLVLGSNLVNMVDFMLSVLMCFTCTISEFPSCSSSPTMHELSSWLILWTDLPPCQSCCCWCVDLQTPLKWFYFPHSKHFFHTQGTALVGALYQSICISHFFLHSRCHMVAVLHTLPNNVKFFCLLYTI